MVNGLTSPKRSKSTKLSFSGVISVSECCALNAIEMYSAGCVDNDNIALTLGGEEHFRGDEFLRVALSSMRSVLASTRTTSGMGSFVPVEFIQRKRFSK